MMTLVPRALVVLSIACSGLTVRAETIVRPSFDCTKARTASEKKICADEGLAKLDLELADAYQTARTHRNIGIASQVAWLKSRDMTCGATPSTKCLGESIETRIRSLRISAIYGVWGPGGRAFETRGNLTVRKDTMTWGGCKRVPYRLLSYQRMDEYPGDPFKGLTTQQKGPYEVVLVQVAESPCFRHERYIQFAIPLSFRLHANLVLYESPEHFKKDYFSWGGFGRRDVPLQD